MKDVKYVSKIQGASRETGVDVSAGIRGPAHFTARHFVHLSWMQIMKTNSLGKWPALFLHGQVAELPPQSDILNTSLKITTSLVLAYLSNKFAFEENQNIF